MTTLGKYELHEQIGKGGFGTVYRAVDVESGNEVAVKVLHPQLMLDENFIKQFLKEGRILGSIEHPNIVQILDIGETDGRVFIVMKYMGGGSLEQRLINRPVNYREALRVLQQISAGLGAAHSKGWVHLDMKPANILFDLDGQAVISDFGLARTVQMTSSDEKPGGTPFYRAPELWNGTPPVSHATDIYSLGCIFYEMITGRVLCPGKTPDQVLTRHLIHGPKFDPNTLPRETPAWVLGVLQKAVARDPNQRYQRVEDFFRALNTAPVETPHRKSKKWIAIVASVAFFFGACPILAGIILLSSGSLKILEPAMVSFLTDMSTAFPVAPLPAVTSTSIAKPTKAAAEPITCPVLPEPDLTESGLIDEVIMAKKQ